MATSSTTHITTTHIRMSLISSPSDRVAHDRAGHAVATTSALAQLEALDRDHLDPRCPHLLDGVGVALIGDDDARLDGHDVVAVVPLLALLLVVVTTGL